MIAKYPLSARSVLAIVATIVLIAPLPARAQTEKTNPGATSEKDPYRRWALALPGIVMELNRERHDILSPYAPGEGSVESQKRSLVSWWGIENRESLIRTMSDLSYNGHAPLFHSLVQMVGQELAKGKSADEVIAEKKGRMKDRDFGYLQFIALNYGRFEGKNLMLWDWGRIVSLARWGYFCGYVDEAEAWDFILRAAALVHDAYGSWEQYGELYALARSTWAAGFGDEILEYVKSERVMGTLLAEGGAWKEAPWPDGVAEENVR